MFFVYYLQYDLQWLMIHCDPTKPEREGCSELPVSRELMSITWVYMKRTLKNEFNNSQVCTSVVCQKWLIIQRKKHRHFSS